MRLCVCTYRDDQLLVLLSIDRSIGGSDRKKRERKESEVRVVLALVRGERASDRPSGDKEGPGSAAPAAPAVAVVLKANVSTSSEIAPLPPPTALPGPAVQYVHIIKGCDSALLARSTV